MRDFLNVILAFIGSSSLTDEEFDEFTPYEDTFGFNISTFNALKMLLIERDEVTEEAERLKLYFMAKGVPGLEAEVVVPAVSNIFIGSPL